MFLDKRQNGGKQQTNIRPKRREKGGNKTAGTAVESGPEETEPGSVRVVCTKSRSWTGETAVEEGGGREGRE